MIGFSHFPLCFQKNSTEKRSSSIGDQICLKAKTCCGSADDDKEGTFGYARVLQKVKKLGQDKVIQCEGFPVPLVLSKEELEDDKAVMNTRLSNQNFKGEIQERLEKFVDKVGFSTPMHSSVITGLPT